MIISTRESKECRERVLHLGISQISGASRTSVGGYSEPEPEDENSEQFDVSDKRTLDEVVHWLMDMKYIPSFCTACYREGRTGDRFMSLCKTGQIQNCCHPNALMTLKEFLMDYASPETRKIGEELIRSELVNIPRERTREIVVERLAKIENGREISVSERRIYMSLNAAPSANRVHISFFGRRNTGKSSLLNAVTGQEMAVVSDVKGTTTDPVQKAWSFCP